MSIRKYLEEATSIAPAFTDDGTGICTDDDLPTGTGVFGDKYIPEIVPNRLTGATKRFVPDLTNWNWNEFEHSMGMGSKKNYSDTLDSMENMFGKERFWKHTNNRRTDKLNPEKEKLFKQSDANQKAKLGDDENDETIEVRKQEITEMDILSRIKEHLNEAELAAPERREITKVIMGNKNVKMNLKSMKLDVQITDMKGGTKFEYPANQDLTLALVDIADSVGMEFTESTKNKRTTFTMKG